jgi:hypothetical protein
MSKRTKKQILRDKAWKVFAQWIRNRDKRCVTCTTGMAEQAGHFWHAVLDFDEENINGQCVRCNHWLSGNLASYSVYLLNKLGKKGFDALDIRHTRAIGGEGHDIEFYQSIIDKYDE